MERLGLKPLARIVGYAQAEVAPKWLFLAPVEGVRRLLDRIELPIEAFDLIEINEAFAAQTLADGRELGFDWDKVNVNGGAIAARPPDRGERRPDRGHAPPRTRTSRRPLRARDPVPGRRRLGGHGRGTGLTGSPYTRAEMTDTAVETPTSATSSPGSGATPPAARPSRAATRPTRRDVIGRFQQGTAADVAHGDQGRRYGRCRCGAGRRRPSAARSCTPSARSWRSTRSGWPGR